MMGPDYGLLGTLVLVFLFMMLSNGRDMRASVAQYIAMRNENLDLAKRYQAAAMDAENANREKTRLLAAASHDLRQPIHAIGLYMETLSLETMEPKARQTLVRIRSSLQTLSRLFNSLLDVSLLDSGKIQVKDGTFDLQDMLNHILDDYEPLAEIANVTLMMECERVGIFGDSILIRRMVQNLLSNAIRHSAGGSVRVCVQQDKGQVSISVIDEGPGIAKEYESFIFEEFTQITSRSTRLQHHEKNATMTEKGLGLGLAIVRRLADLQSLTLKMETSPAGTSMTISGLKAAELIETTPEQHSPSARAESAFAQKTILVVDDDPETLEATTDLLRNWGCTVVSAASLEEIVWQTQKPDLVISDYSFGPDYTGIEIVARLRQAFGADLKALIISGDSTEEVEMRIKQADLLLIRKPVQPVQLRSAMLQAFLADREPQTTVAE
jgi:two-component system, sensor histidine kinase